MNRNNLPYARDIKAAIKAAPSYSDAMQEDVFPGDQYKDDANRIKVRSPEELRELLMSYTIFTQGVKAPLSSTGSIERRITHEVEHADAFRRLGFKAITYSLLVPFKPTRFPILRASSQLAVHDESEREVSDEEWAIVAAHPTIPSEFDIADLALLNHTVVSVDQLAKEKGLPRPLSLYGPEDCPMIDITE